MGHPRQPAAGGGYPRPPRRRHGNGDLDAGGRRFDLTVTCKENGHTIVADLSGRQITAFIPFGEGYVLDVE